MELSALECYGKSIVSSDGKKLGVFVNLITNRNSFESTIAVFPGLASSMALQKVGKAASTVGSFGTRILQNVIPGLADASDVVSSVQYEVVGEVGNRADRQATTISATYYCIPAVNVKKSEDNSLILDLGSKDCQDWYRNIAPSTEAEIAFFDQTYYKGPYRTYPITLNLQSLRGILIKDPAGSSARIMDVKFDPSTGAASRFEVMWKTEKKYLDVKFIKIEYGSCTSSVGFEEASQQPSTPTDATPQTPTPPETATPSTPTDTAPKTSTPTETATIPSTPTDATPQTPTPTETATTPSTPSTSSAAPTMASTPTAASSAETKYCISCGAKILARAVFCNKCGEKQT